LLPTLTINHIINLPTVSLGYSELFVRAGVAEKRWSEAQCGEGGRGAGVTEIGWNAEQLFHSTLYVCANDLLFTFPFPLFHTSLFPFPFDRSTFSKL